MIEGSGSCSGSTPLTTGSRRSHSLPEVVQLGGGHRVYHELDLLFSVAPGVGLSLLALALQGALNLRQLGQGSLQALPRVPTETEWDRVNKPVKAVIFLFYFILFFKICFALGGSPTLHPISLPTSFFNVNFVAMGTT